MHMRHRRTLADSVLSTMLSTLLSTAGCRALRAGRARNTSGRLFSTCSLLRRLPVTACNGLKRREYHFAKVDVEGSNPFPAPQIRVEPDAITNLFTPFAADFTPPRTAMELAGLGD